MDRTLDNSPWAVATQFGQLPSLSRADRDVRSILYLHSLFSCYDDSCMQIIIVQHTQIL
jgi:hypothetical protein